MPWRDLVYQAALLALVALVIGGMAWNAADALQRQNIASGFGFLNNTAGFDVVQTLVAYDETSTYGRVLLVGVLNTLLVAVIGVVLATALGLSVGIGQISSNWLVARLCRAYVEVTRNVPLLLQLFFWYFAVLRALPGPRDSWSLLGSVFLNNRGLYLPRPLAEPGFDVLVIAFAVGLIAAAAYAHLKRLKRERTGRSEPTLRYALALMFLPVIVAAAIMQFPVRFSWPELAGFDFEGGVTVLPELIALVIALSTYTSGYIAEIVRAGIQGGFSGARPEKVRGVTTCDCPPGPTPDHTTADKPVPEPDQELVIGGCDRLSRSCLGFCRHDIEPDRAGHRDHCHHHGRLPGLQPAHERRHELVQQSHRADGALAPWPLRASLPIAICPVQSSG
jgi:His/Glu/Gln/Arg/opine family amino acid ABC transporter permease subunit